ncbi:MAG: hypothetical protein ACYTEX_28320 [Planctomycetota bacterium]
MKEESPNTEMTAVKVGNTSIDTVSFMPATNDRYLLQQALSNAITQELGEVPDLYVAQTIPHVILLTAKWVG